MEQWLTSVGIDVGTSTTKWIASRLRLARTSGGGALPRYEIVERCIDYESPLYSTPLRGLDQIDAPALVTLLEQEYARAGLKPEAVDTGAVIVTGETASRKDAEQVVHGLARVAGPFVAAAAGADLEALLAGTGSGARQRSLETDGVIANVDIGGGTANAVYFRRGERVATATFHIGGRLVRLDAEGCVEYVAAALQRWAAAARDQAAAHSMPAAGAQAELSQLRRFSAQLAELLLRCVCGEQAALHAAEPLFAGAPVKALPVPQEVWISGGVGSLMKEPPPASLGEAARFGDMGPLLAAALSEQARLISSTVPVRAAAQTARATVIGAGAYSIELSGATMYASPGALPLRNTPVVVCALPSPLLPPLAAEADEQQLLCAAITAALERGVSLYGQASIDPPPFALALRLSGYCSYRRLQQIAAAIAAGYSESRLVDTGPLIVCEGDMAKALAYSLLPRLSPAARLKLVCLDQLAPAEGEYLDIGAPVKEGLVPVIIKSLVFTGARTEV